MTPSWWNLEASGWAKLGLALGARHFDELGYDGLYECIAVAEAEVPGRRLASPSAPSSICAPIT